VSANTVTTYAVNVGDANGNVRVGRGAGLDQSAAILANSSNNTFIGTNAGSSVTGSSNICIGYAMTPSAGSNNTLMIGSGTNNATIRGDLLNKRIAIGRELDTNTNIIFDTHGIVRIGSAPLYDGKLGINVDLPSSYHLDVSGNMRIQDNSGGLLTFVNGVQSSSGGFYSATGVLHASPTSILLKKGMFIISAFSNDGVAYAGYVGIAYDATHQIQVSSNFTGASSIITQGANSVNVLGVGTTWTITYFPSP
jgi:hypothetical protein